MDTKKVGSLFGNVPNPCLVDVLMSKERCPDALTLEAAMVFSLACIEQFRREGCSEEEAIDALSSWLGKTSQDRIREAWERIGRSSIKVFLDQGTICPSVLVKQSDPLNAG